MRAKMRTCVCNPAALKAAEELHARSKGYSTSVFLSPLFSLGDPPSNPASLGDVTLIVFLNNFFAYQSQHFEIASEWVSTPCNLPPNI